MPSSPANAPTAAIPTAARADTILRAANLHRSFEMGDSVVTVLKGADLSLRRGEFVAIEGRSGSGKSTLLHILGALEGMDSGSLLFEGEEYGRPHSAGIKTGPRQWRWHTWALVVVCILTASVASLLLYVSFGDRWGIARGLGIGLIVLAGLLVALIVYRLVASYAAERPTTLLRNTQFGFVFQFYYLLPELDVLENTMLATMVENGWFAYLGKRAALRAKATALLAELGLSHRLTHRPNQLWGGERQRVAIARALMNDPKILFADEPTGNLDYETGRQIMAVLEKLHRDKGQTIVMVTHDRALAREADRVLVLKNGKLEKAE